MTDIHSEFSPSQLPRIVRCPGSVRLTRNMPRGTSEYAREGTMLHKVVEDCLTMDVLNVPGTIIAQYNLIPEQTEAVQDILDWVFALRSQYSEYPDAYEVIESKVSLKGYTESDDLKLQCGELEDVYGTLDYSFIVPSLRLLVAADWKFGKGVEVFPDTEQLKAYALGKLKNLKLAQKYQNIQLVIGQPRLYAGEPFKTYETTSEELIAWMKEKLIPSILEANSKNPSFHASEKACRWCEAKQVCEQRQKQAMQAAQDVFAIHATMPNQVNIDQITEILGKLNDLKVYIKDIEDFAVARIMKGSGVPGYKLVAGRSIRRWKDDVVAQDTLEEKLGEEMDTSIFFKDPEFKSIAQVEKLIKPKQRREEWFTELWHKPQGSPTLVSEMDPREPLQFETAEERFQEFVDPNYAATGSTDGMKP